jgi:gluconolactonase
VNRRAFLAGAAAISTAGAAAAQAPSPDAFPEGPFGETGVPLPAPGLPLGPLPDSRYPDPHVEALDKRFKGSVGTGGVERVASGLRWAEGPAYFAAGRYLLFSDAPNNRILRLDEDDNHLSVFRQPSMNANGNTVDREGRLVTCEHTGRRVVRTEHDGRLTVLADRYEGKRFNSPNDIVVASDGSIWFTDPDYGRSGWYEGLKGEREQPGNFVYRIDGRTGRVTKVLDDLDEPNGICFSPDEKTLYVIDSGAPKHIRAFDVDLERGRLSRSRVFVGGFSPGLTDGMRCDVDGNVWCSIGWGDPKEDGVRCYGPEGALLGKIHLPETCANLAFGGLLRNRLYMCASTSVYACYVNTRGAALP